MNTTFVPENGVNPLGDEDQPSGALPIASTSNEPTWYTVGENSASNQFPAINNNASGAFSQVSGQSSSLQQSSGSGSSTAPRSVPSPHARAVKRQGPGKRLLVILGVALLLVIAGSVSVFANAAPRLFVNHQQTQTVPTQSVPVPQQHKKTTLTPLMPTSVPKLAKNLPTPIPAQVPEWLPNQLPTSCTAAGVIPSQGLNANNLAIQFTLREETISYQHIGGLQSSTSLMTPKTKTLRFVNDRRSNPNFAQQVLHEKLIQLPGNLQPTLQQCQSQAGQIFAWTVVAFNRVTQCITDNQGKACPPNPNFVSEMDQQNKPVIHRMTVLMVMVPQGQDNPPLWLGWSVVDYMIDAAPTLPSIPSVGQV